MFWLGILGLPAVTIVAFGAQAPSLENVGFQDLAAGLSVTTSGQNCRYTQNDLTAIESKQYLSPNFDADTYAGDWACLELTGHLKDDALEDCTPSPNSVFQFSPKSSLSISGKEAYHFASVPMLKLNGLFVRKPYRYEVFIDPDGSVSVTVKIHFSGDGLEEPGASDLIRKGLDQAATLWSNQSPGGKVKFHFLSVESQEEAGFNVKLEKKDVGDLYDSKWAMPDFDEGHGNVVAHEVGHMMGIPDEYDPVRATLWQVKDNVDTRRCNVRGLMCNPYEKKIYPYYYYLILRRAACAARSDLKDTIPTEALKNPLEFLKELEPAKTQRCE